MLTDCVVCYTVMAEGEVIDMETIGAKLRRLRIAKGMTIGELARASGVSKGRISQLENERSQTARSDTLDLLAKGLGFDSGAIFFDDSV